MAKQCKSEAFAAVHETARDLYDAGLMDRKTLEEFDEMCIAPINELSPGEISAIRQRENVNMASFALCLNVPVGLVKKWELGLAQPRGAALKLLALVDRLGLEKVS